MKNYLGKTTCFFLLATKALWGISHCDHVDAKKHEELGRNSQFNGVGTIVANRCSGKSKMHSNLGLCTGVAIDSRTVLTAASCLRDGEIVSFYISDPKAESGWSAFRGTVERHPEYSCQCGEFGVVTNLQANLALIHLNQSLYFTDPIEFNLEEDLNCKKCFVVGCGELLSSANPIFPDYKTAIPTSLNSPYAFTNHLFYLDKPFPNSNESFYAIQFCNPPIDSFGLVNSPDLDNQTELEGIALRDDLGAPSFINDGDGFQMFGWIAACASTGRHGAINYLSAITPYYDWITSKQSCQVTTYVGNRSTSWSESTVWSGLETPTQSSKEEKRWNAICQQAGELFIDSPISIDKLYVNHPEMTLHIEDVAETKGAYLASGVIELFGKLGGEVYLHGACLKGSGTLYRKSKMKPWNPALFHDCGELIPTGTIFIEGNFLQKSAASTCISSPYARLIVQGNATVGGTLVLNFPLSSLGEGREHTFIEAKALYGRYDKVIIAGEEVDSELLVYNSDSISITRPKEQPLVDEEDLTEDDTTLEEAGPSIAEEENVARSEEIEENEGAEEDLETENSEGLAEDDSQEELIEDGAEDFSPENMDQVEEDSISSEESIEDEIVQIEEETVYDEDQEDAPLEPSLDHSEEALLDENSEESVTHDDIISYTDLDKEGDKTSSDEADKSTETMHLLEENIEPSSEDLTLSSEQEESENSISFDAESDLVDQEIASKDEQDKDTEEDPSRNDEKSTTLDENETSSPVKILNDSTAESLEQINSDSALSSEALLNQKESTEE